MKFFTFFLILIISSSLVYGLKVESREIIPFQPGVTIEEDVCIIPEGINQLELSVSGNTDIELEATKVEIQKYGCVKYKVNMPESYEKPGIQQNIIYVKEATPPGGMIVALVRVGHQIWIDVPYPGKYLEVKPSGENKEAGEPVQLKAKITSKGDEVINFITGEFYVYNQNDELVGKLDSNTVTDLQPQTSSEIYAVWDSGNNPVGDYYLTAKVRYDDKEEEAEARFKLGDVEIRVVSGTPLIYKGGVVPYEVVAESYWSDYIKNTKAEIVISNASGRITSFETYSADFKPWQKRTIKGFVETNTLELGNYSANITLFYEDKTNSKVVPLEVAEVTIPKTEEPGFLDQFDTMTKFLLISTFLFAIVAVILVLLMLKDHRRKD